MPRIRTVKPELWQSPEIMNISHSARLLFVGLITQADDEGRGSADARKLKASIFGGDDITAENVKEWLAELAGQCLAVLYVVEGFGDLYWLPSWELHQVVAKPTPSKYPMPDTSSLPERYRIKTGTLPERYRNGTGDSTGTLPGDRMDRKEGKDRKGLPERSGSAIAPLRPVSEAAEAWVSK